MMTLHLLSSGGKPMISEFDTIPLEAIALSPELLRQAIALSQSANNQWQAYLDAIAYLSVSEWLRDRLPNNSLDISNANCLQVNGFTVYVLAMTQSAGDLVEIPRNIIDLDKTYANNSNLFIVVVEIQEEIEQALILGFIRHIQLIEYLSKRERNTFQVPLALFDDEPERLLLYLQHLEPVKALQPEAIKESSPVSMNELILNTGLWLQEQLDEVAKTLSWYLLPTCQPNYVSAMRAPAMELQTIFSEVALLALNIPDRARSAYQDFQLGDRYLRLYATVWTDDNRSGISEWSLLFVLGSQTIGEIPDGVRMRIRDRHQILVDRRLEPNTNDLYLYACVTGDRDEIFSVSISLPSGVMLTLPAFAFHPDAL
ncbi:MAG: hypothetical protein DCF19_15840 [Pseudanabaena frigida]|uniref:DUF1822 domain-containing protein n=1 Tax=Pseudanabaena frigida TaxID=945775 RepID=A0A2W4W2D4_9CYAN|nr:MAG: hypothetical protein DCF19_15840 [Pseudanabaena frigida]